jgi:hypothetical protein
MEIIFKKSLPILGAENQTAENYPAMVDDLVQSYKGMGCNVF